MTVKKTENNGRQHDEVMLFDPAGEPMGILIPLDGPEPLP